MVYLALKFFLKIMLQLRRFGLYFERILNKKWLLSYRYNDINCTHAREIRRHAPGEILYIIDAIWCVLMYILVRFCLKKSTIILYKN